MLWFLRILGVILILAGGVWFLQGINVVPVGFMAGQIQYSVLGVVAVVIGVGLLFWSYRGKRSGSTAGKRS